MNIYIINLERDSYRLQKYKKDKEKYIIYTAVDGSKLSDDNEYLKKIICYWNISDKLKRNVVGCLLSHINIMKEIVNKKINKTIIMEDDAVLDFETLDKINLDNLPQDKMIYFGGIFRPTTIKNNKDWSYSDCINNLKPGLNEINTDKYKLGGTHSYYFPTWEICQKVLNYLESKERIRAIDTEFILMQKKRHDLCSQFYYPALGYLDIDEAKKGFTGKAYGIPRNMKNY